MFEVHINTIHESMGLLYLPLLTYIWLICIVFIMVPGKCREEYTMDGMGSCRLRLTCEPILKVVAMPSVPCEQNMGYLKTKKDRPGLDLQMNTATPKYLGSER